MSGVVRSFQRLHFPCCFQTPCEMPDDATLLRCARVMEVCDKAAMWAERDSKIMKLADLWEPTNFGTREGANMLKQLGWLQDYMYDAK